MGVRVSSHVAPLLPHCLHAVPLSHLAFLSWSAFPCAGSSTWNPLLLRPLARHDSRPESWPSLGPPQPPGPLFGLITALNSLFTVRRIRL